MPPKASKPAKSSIHKAKAKDVSNVYFNYDHAVKILKAKRCDPQQLLFLERFLKKNQSYSAFSLVSQRPERNNPYPATP